MIKDNAKPITDMHDLINITVDQRMKAYVVYNAEEHHQTRRAFTKLEDVVIESGGRSPVREVVQNVLIAILYIGMIILLTGC